MSRIINQRELRNQSASVLREVEAGETIGTFAAWQTEAPSPAPTAASEPRPQNVGPAAAEARTSPGGDSVGVHAGGVSVVEEMLTNRAGAEGGVPQ